jgi:hypothetical protein
MKPSRFCVWSCLHLIAAVAASVPAANAQNGVLQFSSANYSTSESSGAARVTVTRSGGSAGEVTVSFMTIDSGGGTAGPEQDYFPTNGTLAFGPGVTSQSFYVPIINDAAHEESETILLELQVPSGGATLGARVSATITIADNDACVFTLGSTSQTLDAAGGLAPPIMVTATEGCSWTAVEVVDRDWLAILEASGTGNGQVVYSFDPNPGSSSRTASLRIGGRTFTVTQLGVPPPDLIPPTVTFSSPAANSRQTNEIMTITGKATDNVGVTLVEFRLENEAGMTDYFPATGTVNWSATFGGLIPGTNTIRVRAHDAGNLAVEAVRSVVFVEVAPLTVVATGEGSIAPVRHGAFLDVGKGYLAQAKPARGHFFTHWSGTVEAPDNPLSFTMYPGFVLQGNFVPSPFTGVAGSYSGLFSEFENNRLESSGSFGLRLTELGAFSARLVLAGQRFAFSGKFAVDGLATNLITRSGAGPLTIWLTLDLAGGTDQITGTISDGIWTASVLADRAALHPLDDPAIQAGRYTLILPGNDAAAATEPGGDSFGTVTVDARGNVKFSGTLADGTKVSQRAPLSKNGWWPLFVPLYGGGGSVLSWVIFLDSSEASFTGVATWIKSARPGAVIYPGGFTVQRDFSGSSYRPPTNATERVLALLSGAVGFSAGNLTMPFENEVVLGEGNRVANLGANDLTLSIARASGLFSGSVTPPGATRSVSFRGALHQKQNYGSGFFLGADQSGRVRFAE